jgi:hypothetical protein
LYFDSKANDIVPDYQTLNSETGIYENTSLVITEYKDYFRVRINSDDSNINPTPKVYLSNYPNPFNPITKIEYYLPEDSLVSIEVYNIKGQRVASLVNEYRLQEINHTYWDSKDSNGDSLGSGVYFASLQYKGNKTFLKMLLMK